jgi:hypothetical protein
MRTGRTMIVETVAGDVHAELEESLPQFPDERGLR